MIYRIQKSIMNPITWVILVGAAIYFALHLYMAPGYGFFFDEMYTIALSQHLAFGYVDLPPLVPALVALSRWMLGESLFALHIVPALAGSLTLVMACLITRELGGKITAVVLTALTFIAVPGWLVLFSIFGYDSIDQLILAVFLFFVVRLLRSGEKRLWLVLGIVAGIACMTKMTILFLGPGFLLALLISKYRQDLLSPWPYLGALICLMIVSPYLLWQSTNHWPTLEYWMSYGSIRVYQASFQQYLTNVILYVSPLLLPIWLLGFYRIFRRFDGTDYSFFGTFLVITFGLLLMLHATPRMIIALFIPLLAAGAIFIEELVTNKHQHSWVFGAVNVYLFAVAIINITISLPLVPMDQYEARLQPLKFLYEPLREFVGNGNNPPVLLSGRIGWEDLTRDVAQVYEALPPDEQQIAGIYTDSYGTAGAIDLFGPQYGLPHAVSGSLNYFMWGPGYRWDVMVLVTNITNPMSVFFKQCEQKSVSRNEYMWTDFYIFVCKDPTVPVDKFWNGTQSF